MDPLSAIGLASAITQFIDFAGKIAVGTHQVYTSGAGSTAADADIELCASELDGLCTRLSTTGLSPKSEDDQALCRLAGRCKTLSTQLSALLRSTRAKDPNSRWNCFVSSVKTQIKKTERDELLNRLSECRAQLEIQLVRLTRYEIYGRV